MTEALRFTLAGRVHSTEALTLRQVRDLYVAAAAPDSEDPRERIERSFDFGVDVITIALRGGQVLLSREQLYDLQISPDEMREVSDQILLFAGLIAAPSATS